MDGACDIPIIARLWQRWETNGYHLPLRVLRASVVKFEFSVGENVAEKVVIIGSGPAGWSAAIYAARAELKPLVFEGAITEENRLAGTLPLGQLALTTEVENYAGFPAGRSEAVPRDRRSHPERLQYMDISHEKHAVSGPELMELMRQQAMNFGTRIVTDDIVEVDFKRRPFQSARSGGQATSKPHADHRRHGRQGELSGPAVGGAFKNRGVSACAVCDGALPRFRNKPLVVVGGGDSAVEEATLPHEVRQSKVHMVHRRDKLRASKIMHERALDNPKIEMDWNSRARRSAGQRQGRRHRRAARRARSTASTTNCAASGVFLAIGHTPNTAFLEGQVATDRQRLHQVDHAIPHQHQRGRRVRRRRRGRRLLPPGDHRRRHRLHGRARRRTLAGASEGHSIDASML